MNIEISQTLVRVEFSLLQRQSSSVLCKMNTAEAKGDKNGRIIKSIVMHQRETCVKEKLCGCASVSHICEDMTR
ncbi:hypothetical protein MPTK1_7g18710 [Marchantia polymorpha subsp. ruderalis]|uniref:Uncharacterized protein n=2 Tax=Marchantia polymorpha TaxID=3197 RepID=A0AAF6C166_MARPO|nr:hypothetical protein MARPO_0067s0106 [Marchantia polymorpha]BBN18000.1 hypothetical protein Mp_7g18710 [Marchantia polymorpha subsp. ruderalis]|eukprot:PTQ36035.1 hypothetical protein MARPO_0067s0106 [Marchantia polymorpha]